MSETETKMCVSIEEKPLSEIICTTRDVTEALSNYRHVSGVLREVIDKIDKYTDYLNQHFKNISLYKYPKI